MALIIQFGPWNTTTTLTSVTWEVEDPDSDGISEAHVSIRKEGQPLVFTDAGTQYSGLLSLSTDQFQGEVIATVKARNFAGDWFEEEAIVTVDNFVEPSGVAWLAFQDPAAFAITFKWDAIAVSPSNEIWRIINKKVDDTEVILAEVDVALREAMVATPIEDLNEVRIYGVDAFGNVSAASPVLTFKFPADGPQITLRPWVVNGQVARASWFVRSEQFITGVAWRLEDDNGTVLTGQGLPDDFADIPIAGYQGNIRVYLTAVDSLDRDTQVSSQIAIYNIPPPKPVVLIEEVGITFVRVKIIPGGTGPSPVPVARANIFGPNGEVFVETPFVHTFTGLIQQTSYAFAARMQTPSGLKGELSNQATATTLPDPSYIPPELPGYTGGPFLPRVFALITDDVRHYVLQLSVDTRLRAPVAVQVVEPPVGFETVLEFFTSVGPFLGDILRRESEDEATHTASLLIDQLVDPLMKLAVLCERIEFGDIYNPG